MNQKMFFKKVFDKLDGKFSRREIETVLKAFSDILIETLVKNEVVSTTLGVFKSKKESKKTGDLNHRAIIFKAKDHTNVEKTEDSEDNTI